MKFNLKFTFVEVFYVLLLLFMVFFVALDCINEASDIKKQEDCIIFNGEEYCRR